MNKFVWKAYYVPSREEYFFLRKPSVKDLYKLRPHEVNEGDWELTKFPIKK